MCFFYYHCPCKWWLGHFWSFYVLTWDCAWIAEVWDVFFFFSFHFLLFLCPKSSKLIYVLSWLSSKRADGTFWKISKSLFSAVNLEVSGQNRASDLCSISSNLLIPQLRKLDQKKFCTCLASYAILVTKQGSRPLMSQSWATWLQCLSIKPNRSQVPCIKTQSSILILCTCYVRAILTFS